MLYYDMRWSPVPHIPIKLQSLLARERGRSPEDLSSAGSVARLNSVAHPILHPIRCRCHVTSYYDISSLHSLHIHCKAYTNTIPTVNSAERVVHACFSSGSTHHLFVSITVHHHHTSSFPGYINTIKQNYVFQLNFRFPQPYISCTSRNVSKACDVSR